jgi:hypothetical protein
MNVVKFKFIYKKILNLLIKIKLKFINANNINYNYKFNFILLNQKSLYNM